MNNKIVSHLSACNFFVFPNLASILFKSLPYSALILSYFLKLHINKHNHFNFGNAPWTILFLCPDLFLYS